MRSRTNATISVRAVHAHTATLIEDHLQSRDHGPKCRATVLINILRFAAARMRPTFDACGRLREAPSDQAVRDALIALLLRNVWVWFHWNVLADRHANGRLAARLDRLRLTPLTLMLQHAAEHLLGRHEDPEAETDDWIPLTLRERACG